jgi:hypothetical protein
MCIFLPWPADRVEGQQELDGFDKLPVCMEL